MSLSQNVRRTIATLMFIFGLIFLGFNPAEGVVLPLIGYVLLVSLTVWLYLHLRNSSDEVVRAANHSAFSFGAPIGLGLSFLAIFVVRFIEPASNLINGLAEGATAGPGAAAAGFAMGILFTCCMVMFCAGAAWMSWWLAHR